MFILLTNKNKILKQYDCINHLKLSKIFKSLKKFLKRVVVVGLMLHFPSILNAQYIDTKWTVTGYFGELWYAEEKDILGKKKEFFKWWANGIFYSCDYAGQSATYNAYTIKEFLENKEFELVNQDNAFSKVFAQNGLTNENSKVFVHRITCNGKKVSDRKVLYPFITIDRSNKAFYVYEGAIITLKFDR